jgi:hypothetical protein
MDIFCDFSVMIFGIIIFIVISVVVLIIGGRFWKDRPLPRKRGVLYAAIFILLFTGLLIMIVGSARIRRDLEIQSWPSVTGEIISSDVAGSRAFHPEITYSYTIDGVRYIGISDLKMPGFGGKRSRLETAEIIVEEYPPGSGVDVYYDPDIPKQSTLYAGLSYGACLQMTFGFLLYLGGVFMLPWRFRLRSRAMLR